MPAQKDYLHTCLALHSDLTEILYGRRQDIRRIENVTAEIRKSRQLTYENIEKILDRDIWNADMFGYWPKRQDIESILKSRIWNFKDLPGRQDDVITDMYSVFRQIEPISVILRFVMPEEYGIISAPVEKVLGMNYFGSYEIHPEYPHLEKYKTYLCDLRSLRKERDFDRVADVDMALWVLQIGVLERRFKDHEDQEILRRLREDFRQDSKLREIQARNLTKHLFRPDTMHRLDLAEALLSSDLQFAGQIAGIEFERSIKRKTKANPKDGLRNEVEKFCRGKPYNIRSDCEADLNTRNRAAHPDPKPPLDRMEIENLVNITRQISR